MYNLFPGYLILSWQSHNFGTENVLIHKHKTVPTLSVRRLFLWTILDLIPFRILYQFCITYCVVLSPWMDIALGRCWPLPALILLLSFRKLPTSLCAVMQIILAKVFAAFHACLPPGFPRVLGSLWYVIMAKRWYYKSQTEVTPGLIYGVLGTLGLIKPFRLSVYSPIVFRKVPNGPR